MALTSVRSCLLVIFFTLSRVGGLSSDHYHTQGDDCTNTKRTGENDVHDMLIFPNEAASHRPRPHPQNISTGDLVDRAGLSFDVDPAPCPEGQAYCDTDDDYPTDKVKELLKKQAKSLLGHFNIEVEEEDTGNRFGPGDDEDLCPSNARVIYPKKAQASHNDKFEFVVNTEGYRQGVRVEECINGEECSIPGSLSVGYSSRCIQKKIKRTLVVINKDSSAGEGLITMPFEFPSCCACRVTMSSSNRFGLPAADSPTLQRKTFSSKATKSSIKLQGKENRDI